MNENLQIIGCVKLFKFIEILNSTQYIFKASHFYGPSWTWNKERQQYYYHKFVKEQPDLNYKNPLVHQEMKKILKFWLEKGAGGFRVDAVNYLYETEGFPDEPLTGLTDDPNSYSYTHHIYTKDLVNDFMLSSLIVL